MVIPIHKFIIPDWDIPVTLFQSYTHSHSDKYSKNPETLLSPLKLENILSELLDSSKIGTIVLVICSQLRHFSTSIGLKYRTFLLCENSTKTDEFPEIKLVTITIPVAKRKLSAN